MAEPVLWLDAQLPPSLAGWITKHFGWGCLHVYELGFHRTADIVIARRAAEAGAIVVSKDRDFVQLQAGPVVWIRTGNVSNLRLREILTASLGSAVARLLAGEQRVEIRDGPHISP